jgi:hypothetical protein
LAGFIFGWLYNDWPYIDWLYIGWLYIDWLYIGWLYIGWLYIDWLCNDWLYIDWLHSDWLYSDCGVKAARAEENKRLKAQGKRASGARMTHADSCPAKKGSKKRQMKQEIESLEKRQRK